ncbi:MAG: glycosyltransferase [Patescibacteria group bacterium]|nr:glycosyltransferase [Patescibacteria group bacterium]
MKTNPIVSIVIPTKNSEEFLENCLKSVKRQTYKNIEVIVVDGKSTDRTLSLAKKYQCKIYQLVPKVKKGTFDAPYKRNYGVKKSKGEYVYYVDADMELPPSLIQEAISLCSKFDALIIPEDSFGIGIWASAKNLERRCYWGDDLIESPRFFRKKVWQKVGGLDETLAGGRDDGDLYEKLKENNYRVSRTKQIVLHNEGKLTVSKLFKKKFMYGKDVLKYVSKRPAVGIASYSPIRTSYLKNWKLFVKRPVDSFFFFIMKTIEVSGGVLGLTYSLTHKNNG